MKTITFQISDETARYIESRIAAGECLNVNEYIAMLIERDLRAEELPRWMEAELLKGIESLERGEGIPWTAETAEKLKQDFLERHRRSRGEVA